MRKAFLITALASVALSAASSAEVVIPSICATILPSEHLPAGKRALVPEDLARIRDIGPIEAQYYGQPFFTLSPDGRRMAFQLRQGDPSRNAYCLAMAVLDLDGKNRPKLVDAGGQPILLTNDGGAVAKIPIGLMDVVTPRWSPDGKWIAYLRRDGDKVQVWRAFADGSGSSALTHSDVDVVDFDIGRDGSTIIYATRPDLERQRRQNQKEGLTGWHYDDRFIPSNSKEPMLLEPAPRQAHVLNLASGAIRPATPEELHLVAVNHQVMANSGAAVGLESADLAIGSTSLSGGALEGSFRARADDGTWKNCNAQGCAGAMRAWWMPGHAHVRFLRQEGWANASQAIYDWDVGNGKVRRLYSTDDVLSSCTEQGKYLICRIDSSVEPERIVRLDPVTGKRTALFDPNPEFAHLTLGRAERLHWRNAFGLETIGDLVLPVGYQKGERYPMVVVQYDTRGFLRGGTGDEYPIQAFANRGYAVLSFKRPAFVRSAGAKNFDEVAKGDLENFADRKSDQSSLEMGVQIAIDRGIADPKHLGISGLSDGSASVEWELIHSKLFAAAAMSTCCFFNPVFTSLTGPYYARHFMALGYPGLLGNHEPFWKQLSFAANARSISTPILMNSAETEFLTALYDYSALREAGDPVDLFEYPGEMHDRWQPAMRLATYKRSLDWFDYWLRGARSNDPMRQKELRHWDELKEEASHKQAA